MDNNERIAQIRESEKKSHTAIYSESKLFHDDNWLKKPIKTVTDLFPFFQSCETLSILDLGCGVGRNCIPIAAHFQTVPCSIDCVDILELAVEKLNMYAEEYGVSRIINGIVSSIDDFSISQDHYNWILAISALEHMDSKNSFIRKLSEIRDGVQKGGIVCLVINSNVREFNKETNLPIPAQFEINLPTEDLQAILMQTFQDFTILKSTIREQHYDIPREWGISDLYSSVVTFVAAK